MKQKEKVYITIIKIVIFCIFLGLALHFANKVLMLKEGTDKYDGFYEAKEDYDILFFGSSRMLDGMQPIELWDEYGITSYNLAQHGECLGRDYWQLVNALKYTHPKMVVFDLSMYDGEYEVNVEDDQSRAYLHKQLDHMPLSKTKIDAVKALCPPELYAEYLFPFILYHGRWNEVGANDFYSSVNLRMGAEARTNIMPIDRFEWSDELNENFNTMTGNFEKIIQLCKENDITPLFICLPAIGNFGNVTMLNSYENYLKNNNIDFLNMGRDNDFLNYKTDFSDTSHLNVSGSIKVTSKIGEYYIQKYGKPVYQDRVVDKWNNILAEFKSAKDYMINMFAQDADSLLMITACDDDYRLEVSANAAEKSRIEDIYPNVDVALSEEGELTIRIFRVADDTPILTYQR